MIQLNLLPDVKMEYIRAQRSRRLVLAVSLIITAISVALMLLMLSYDGLQKKHLSDLNKDIASESTKLQKQPNINKILTVQNQLQSLTQLHAQKPAVSQLFGYLNSVTPAAISITDFNIDFTQQKATVTGASDTLSSVNKYVDTLKFTTYTSDTVSDKTPAFSNVVLSSFGRSNDSQNSAQTATYTIDFNYDPTIFDITQKVNLSVPNLVTTRSQLNQPTALFQAAPAKGGQR